MKDIIYWTIIVLIVIFVGMIDIFFKSPSIDEDIFSDKLKIIEYADYKCEECQRANEVISALLYQYPERIDYEFRHFPMDDMSLRAGVAAECAREQDMFMPYSDKLFRLSYHSLDNYRNIAISLELDINDFDDCMMNASKQEIIEAHNYLALKDKVTATPTFIINGEKVEGYIPIDKFRRYLDD